jgi:hypothetical protein
MDAHTGKIAQYEPREPAAGIRRRGPARMPTYTRFESFKVPLGGQEIALEDVRDDVGGMPLLRIRIRERTRFTIFDIDAATAARWGRALQAWSEAQPGPPGENRP